MTITAEQLRAARALIKMEQRVLSERSGVNVQTLKRYEGGTGPLSGNYQNVTALIAVLEQEGVTFLRTGETTNGGPGVRLLAPGLGSSVGAVGLGERSPD
ncbi:MAG: XRE family transcriptional regulator [Anaerolineales bacterium]